MKCIPSWLPGAGFKRKAKKFAVVLRDLVDIPHNYVKAQLVNILSGYIEACLMDFSRPLALHCHPYRPV